MTPAKMFSLRSRWAVFFGVSVLILVGSGCAALREVANLRKVQFAIDRVSKARLAGIDLSEIRSYEDLSAGDALRLGAALSNDSLPLSFTLHLEATNPESNDVDARLTKMDWTLLLEDRETVSGLFDREVVLPPGERTGVAVDVSLDLVRFFDHNLQELVNLATALRGDGPPTSVKLRVQPTIQTRFGPVQYPSPITVVSKEVGSASPQP